MVNKKNENCMRNGLIRVDISVNLDRVEIMRTCDIYLTQILSM